MVFHERKFHFHCKPDENVIFTSFNRCGHECGFGPLRAVGGSEKSCKAVDLTSVRSCGSASDRRSSNEHTNYTQQQSLGVETVGELKV